jgi:hypothetical protein
MILSGTKGQLDLEEVLILLPASLVKGLKYTQNSVRHRNQYGSITHQNGKNPGSNNRPAFGRQKGRLITSQRHPNNPIWGETGSLRFRN